MLWYYYIIYLFSVRFLFVSLQLKKIIFGIVIYIRSWLVLIHHSIVGFCNFIFLPHYFYFFCSLWYFKLISHSKSWFCSMFSSKTLFIGLSHFRYSWHEFFLISGIGFFLPYFALIANSIYVSSLGPYPNKIDSIYFKFRLINSFSRFLFSLNFIGLSAVYFFEFINELLCEVIFCALPAMSAWKQRKNESICIFCIFHVESWNAEYFVEKITQSYTGNSL